jgi:Raf kinase inhibitor-like YbhB/YbcL family protein
MSKLKVFLILVILLALIAVGCAPNPEPTEMIEPDPQEEPSEDIVDPQDSEEGKPIAMALTSPAFNDGEPIPTRFSCDGDDTSPELDWFGTPEGTVSLALIMDDPDAPVGTWVHWVLYNLPMDLSGLREGMTGVGLDGTNSWDRGGYGGPCPPSGTHRYFFKLYALDTDLALDPGVNKATLEEAMEGHILGQAELMGTYSR